MHTDNFYRLINAMALSWYFLALLYALINYIYDIIGCWISGGNDQLRKEGIVINLSTLTDNGRGIFKIFNLGGQARLQEFKADTLSWLWPITVLAIPTYLYGFSYQIIIKTVEELANGGITLIDYRLTMPLFNWSENIQFIVWFVAIFTSLFTFWQYRNRPLEERTWLSKSDIFHGSRIIFFNSVLSYMIITTMLIWSDFMYALYKMLGDDILHYEILHQDLMYGLRPAYEAVIVLGLAFLAISLLPLIMLIRERSQRFSRGYYLLVYSGVIFVILSGAFVVIQFHIRLGMIQESALYQIISTVDLEISEIITHKPEMLEGLWFYDLVSGLPGGFPVPRWLEFLFTARVVLIPYEIYTLFAAGGGKATLSDILRRVIETVS